MTLRFPLTDVVLRALMLAGVVLVVVALQYAAPHAVWFEAVFGVGLAGWACARPDGSAALAALVVLALGWLRHVRDETTAWAMVAALGVLVFHLATAFAAAAGPGREVDPRTVRRWVTDGSALLVVAGATWLVVRATAGRLESPGALVGGTLLLLALTAALTHLAPERRRPSA